MKGDQNQTVKLTEMADGVPADILIEALDGNGIPAYKKTQQSGGLMKAYMGFSVYGVEIFVNEADLDAAREILAVFQAEDPEAEDCETDEASEAAEVSEEDEVSEPEPDELPESFVNRGASVLRKLILVGVAVFGCWLLLQLIALIIFLVQLG